MGKCSLNSSTYTSVQLDLIVRQYETIIKISYFLQINHSIFYYSTFVSSHQTLHSLASTSCYSQTS